MKEKTKENLLSLLFGLLVIAIFGIASTFDVQQENEERAAKEYNDSIIEEEYHIPVARISQ